MNSILCASVCLHAHIGRFYQYIPRGALWAQGALRLITIEFDDFIRYILNYFHLRDIVNGQFGRFLYIMQRKASVVYDL